MKIYLKNFKCWISKTVVIENKGLHLIVGESGKGKSSILDAIYWCLYGNLQKIISHGEKRCEVEIEYEEGITIKRTRRPNRLVVEKCGEKLEDDIGQEFINNNFGNYFSQTSYIRQNVFENFIFMSATEKLEFLEESVLKKFGVDTLKSRVQNSIRAIEQDINTKTGQYNTYLEILNKTVKPEIVNFPVICHIKNRDIVIKNEHTKIHNFNILIKKLTQKICKSRKKMEDMASIRLSLSSCLSRLENLRESKMQYQSKLKPLESQKFTLTELMTELRQCEESERYHKISEELDSEIKIYNDKLAEEIRRAEDGIKEVDTNKIPILEDKMELLKTALKYIPRVKEITNDLDQIHKVFGRYPVGEYGVDLESQLETLKCKNMEIQQSFEIYKKTLICPCCENRIIFRNSKLEKYDSLISEEEEYTTQIEKNTIKIHELKKIIGLKSKRDELVKELTSIEKKYKGSQTDSQDELNKQLEELKYEYRKTLQTIDENKRLEKMLDNKNFPSLLRSVQIITKLRNKLTDIAFVDKSYDKQDLLEKIDKVKLDNKLRVEYQTTLDTLTLDIEKLEKEIDTYNNLLNLEGNIKECNIQKLEKKLETYKIELTQTTTNVDLISKWEKSCSEMKSYQELELKVTTLRIQLSDLREELTLSEKFKSHIIHAEALAVRHLLDTINGHVQTYLDKFFKNDQLLVKINTEKQIKSGRGLTKTQITLNMEYKGYPIELVNLSGGEISRLNLAFVLAMSEIFKSPILMLDECMSTLDPDNCINILNTIREEYKGKLVLMIHHQITEGLFDTVIEL